VCSLLSPSDNRAEGRRRNLPTAQVASFCGNRIPEIRVETGCMEDQNFVKILILPHPLLLACPLMPL